MSPLHRTKPDVDVDATAGEQLAAAHPVAVRELAPVVANPEEPHVVGGRPEKPAPIFPTEADEIDARREVLENDPTLAGATHHRVANAVRAQLAANAGRAARRQRALATVVTSAAPVFPTDVHAGDLREAIPTISDQEIKSIFAAGYHAYLASVDAREPVLDPEGATR